MVFMRERAGKSEENWNEMMRITNPTTEISCIEFLSPPPIATYQSTQWIRSTYHVTNIY